MSHLRFCARPGCPVRVQRGYCRDHRPRVLAQPVIATHAADYVVYPAVYGSRWKRRARAFLATHPFCIDCVAEGRPNGLATEVDHETPHRGDPVLFWDVANWRPRCKPHHSAKTAREVGLGG